MPAPATPMPPFSALALPLLAHQGAHVSGECTGELAQQAEPHPQGVARHCLERAADSREVFSSMRFR